MREEYEVGWVYGETGFANDGYYVYGTLENVHKALNNDDILVSDHNTLLGAKRAALKYTRIAKNVCQEQGVVDKIKQAVQV